jgi:hypothetical protein
MKRIAIAMSCVAMYAAGPAATRADTIMHMDSVQFISDLQPSMSIDLPSFDNQGGLLTLLSVLVEVSHSASVDLSADNDDPFNAAEVRGRLIRIWSAGGPGVATGANFAAFTPFVPLSADDGDGGNVLNFDPTPPDGVAFGTFGYPLTLVSSHNPAVGLYSTNGPGTVSFLVTPQLMSQDLQWQGSPPDHLRVHPRAGHAVAGGDGRGQFISATKTRASVGLTGQAGGEKSDSSQSERPTGPGSVASGAFFMPCSAVCGRNKRQNPVRFAWRRNAVCYNGRIGGLVTRVAGTAPEGRASNGACVEQIGYTIKAFCCGLARFCWRHKRGRRSRRLQGWPVPTLSALSISWTPASPRLGTASPGPRLSMI